MVAFHNFQNLQNTMTVGNHVVKRLDNVRTLLVDEKALKSTPTEYRILLHLLAGNPVSDKELVWENCSSAEEDADHGGGIEGTRRQFIAVLLK